MECLLARVPSRWIRGIVVWTTFHSWNSNRRRLYLARIIHLSRSQKDWTWFRRLLLLRAMMKARFMILKLFGIIINRAIHFSLKILNRNKRKRSSIGCPGPKHQSQNKLSSVPQYPVKNGTRVNSLLASKNYPLLIPNVLSVIPKDGMFPIETLNSHHLLY